MLRALGAFKRGAGWSIFGPVQRGPRRAGRPGVGAPFWGCSPLLGLVVLWLGALLIWHRRAGAGPSTERRASPDLSSLDFGSEAHLEGASSSSNLQSPLGEATRGGYKGWRGAGEGEEKGEEEEEEGEDSGAHGGGAAGGFRSQRFGAQSWEKQEVGTANEEEEEEEEAAAGSFSRHSHSGRGVAREENGEEQEIQIGTSLGSRGQGIPREGQDSAEDDEDGTATHMPDVGAESGAALGARDGWQRQAGGRGAQVGRWRQGDEADGDDGDAGHGNADAEVGLASADEEHEDGDDSGAVGQRMRRGWHRRGGWRQAGGESEDVDDRRAGIASRAGGDLEEDGQDADRAGGQGRRWGGRDVAQGDEEEEQEGRQEAGGAHSLHQAGEGRDEEEDQEHPREHIRNRLDAAVDVEAKLAAEEAEKEAEAAESEAEDQDERSLSRHAAELRAKQEVARAQEQEMLMARKSAEEEAARKFYGHSASEEDVQVDDSEESQPLEGLDSLTIPGTAVRGANVVRFERALSCLSEGRWAFNATPRWLPWDLNPLNHALQPNYRSCDLLFSQRGGVYGAQAERARLGGGAQWKVRRSLLYEWRTSDPECPFVAFNRASMCRAIGQRNIVIVGDAFSLDMHDAMINHLLTPRTKRMAGWIGDAWANATEGACFVKGHQLCADVPPGSGRRRLRERPTQLHGRRLASFLDSEPLPSDATGAGDARMRQGHGPKGRSTRAAHRVGSNAFRRPEQTKTSLRKLQQADWGVSHTLNHRPAIRQGRRARQVLRQGTQVLQARRRTAAVTATRTWKQHSGGHLGKTDPAIGSLARAKQLAGEDDEDSEDDGPTGEGGGAGAGKANSGMNLGSAKAFRKGAAYAGRHSSSTASGSARAGAATASFAKLGSRFSRAGAAGRSSTAGDPGTAQHHSSKGADTQGSVGGRFDLVKRSQGWRQEGAVVKSRQGFGMRSQGKSSLGAGRAAKIGLTSSFRAGDSTQQLTVDVRSRGGVRAARASALAAGREGGQEAEHSLGGGFNLRVVLNPFLMPDTGRVTRYNNRWLRKLKRWKTDILILTRTALFKDKRLMLQEVRDTLEAVRELYPDMLIIWRNSPAGHPHCERFTRPLKKRPQADMAARGEIPASWGRHAAINAAVRPLLKEYGVIYMDVDAATSLRPDGHHLKLDGTIDCRHYCMPGPLDQWVDLLHNILLLLNHFAEPEAEGASAAGDDKSEEAGNAGSIATEQQESLNDRHKAALEGGDALGTGPWKPLSGEEDEGEDDDAGREVGKAQLEPTQAGEDSSATGGGEAHSTSQEEEADFEPVHQGSLDTPGSPPGTAGSTESVAGGAKKGHLFSSSLWGLFGLEHSQPVDPVPLEGKGQQDMSGPGTTSVQLQRAGAESDEANEAEEGTRQSRDDISQDAHPLGDPSGGPSLGSSAKAHPAVPSVMPDTERAHSTALEDPESKATLEAEAEAEAAVLAAASENHEEEAAAEEALQSKADAERAMVDQILGADAKEAARTEAEAEARLKSAAKRKRSQGAGADGRVNLDPRHEGEGILDDVVETQAEDSQAVPAAKKGRAEASTDDYEEEAGVAFVAGAVQRQGKGGKRQGADGARGSTPGAAAAEVGASTGVDAVKKGSQPDEGAVKAQAARGKSERTRTIKVESASTNTTVPVCADYKQKCIPGTHVWGRQVSTLEKDLACIAGGGKWVPYNVPRLIPWDKNPHRDPVHPNYGTCDALHEKLNNGVYGAKAEKSRAKGAAAWRVRPALKYTYKASRFCPQLLGFDRGDFCQQIGQRNIVLVGDATQLALHDVFLNHLVTLKTSRQAGTMGDAWPSKGQPSCATAGHTLCGDLVPGGFTFRVVQDDLLSGDAATQDSQRWLEQLRTWNASIVILNKGLSKQPNKKFAQSLKHTLEQLRRVMPEVLLIWRNSWRGHADCSNASVPLPSPPVLNASEPGPWDHIPEQNKLARAVAKEFGVVYLDVDTPLSMRPDGHLQDSAGSYDCYFYCIPGPLDHIVRVFYNIIRLMNRHGSSRQ